jgi:hypothetical protein
MQNKKLCEKSNTFQSVIATAFRDCVMGYKSCENHPKNRSLPSPPLQVREGVTQHFPLNFKGEHKGEQ